MRSGRVFARFVVVNVVNTLLYWLLYLLLLLVMPYLAANVLALGIAIVLAYLMNARYAFQVRMTGRSLLGFVITNLTTMGLRTLVVWLLVERHVTGEQLSPLVAVAVTLPLAFVLTKLVMATPTAHDTPRGSGVGTHARPPSLVPAES